MMMIIMALTLKNNTSRSRAPVVRHFHTPYGARGLRESDFVDTYGRTDTPRFRTIFPEFFLPMPANILFKYTNNTRTVGRSFVLRQLGNTRRALRENKTDAAFKWRSDQTDRVQRKRWTKRTFTKFTKSSNWDVFRVNVMKINTTKRSHRKPVTSTGKSIYDLIFT